MRTAIYAGSFDPPTRGHEIRAAVGIGDDHQQNVQLAVAIHRLGREVEKRPAGFRRRRA